MVDDKNKGEESISEDSEVEDPTAKKKKGKKNENKNKQFGGLPRKCFKKLIKKELDKQCQQIFDNMINCKELGGEGAE